MDQIKLNTSNAPTIKIGEIKGSLRIKGWDFDKLRADSDKENTLKVKQDNDIIYLDCSSGCQLRVPTQSEIVIKQVSRELMAKSLEGHLDVKDVKGQVIVKNIGSISISKASSNVNAKQVEGDLKFKSINGNVTIRNVEGVIEVDNCDGNLTIRGNSKGIKTNSNSSTNLRLEIDPNGNYEAITNGNISCRVDSNTDAQVNLKSGANSIRVRTPESKEILTQPEYDFQIGEASSTINLKAKGSIEFRVQSPSDDFSYDFGFEEDFEYLADDITQQISDQIETQIGAITEQLGNILNSSVAIGVGASERTRRNLEAKRRALERKLAKTQRRVDRKIRSRIPSHRSYVRKASDPVSEEEQKMILEMLQNSQISIEEAEVLLAALEGKTVDLQSPANETGSTEEAIPADKELPEEDVEPAEEAEAEDEEQTKE